MDDEWRMDLWGMWQGRFALPQIDHDPRLPAYIATQGPLPHTIADFWQVCTTPLRGLLWVIACVRVWVCVNGKW